MGTQKTKDVKPEASGSNSRVTPNEPMQLDGGWGWLVALGSFVSHFLAGGFDRSGGVFYLKFLERYGGSAAGTAWVLALFSSFRVLFGPLASAMSNRFSCRTVVFGGALLSMAGVLVSGYTVSLISIYFSYGIVTGFGVSMTFTPGIFMVGQYFTKRRGMVVGLVTVGSGIGSFIFPPFTQLLFETFGFQGTFLLLSGIMSHYLVVGAFYRSLTLHRRLEANKRYEKNPLASNGTVVVEDPLLEAPEDVHRLTGSLQDTCNTTVLSSVEYIYTPPTNSQAAGEDQRIEEKMISQNKPERLLHWALLKDVVFVCLCLQSFLYLLSFTVTVTFLPALVKDRGLTIFQGSALISIMGISDAASKMISSVMLDLKLFKRYRLHIYNSVTFIGVVISTLLPSMTQFWHFSLLSAIFGILNGIYKSQYHIIIIEVVGMKHLSSGVGIGLGVNGLSALLGPTIGGLLRDYLGSYSPAFYFGSAGLFLSGSTMALGNFLFHRRDKRPSK